MSVEDISNPRKLMSPREPETLKTIGGSNFDEWNRIVANQLINSVWLDGGLYSDEEKDRIRKGSLKAIVGLSPRDELEGMLLAQMIAAHNAAMECYRRAMFPDQSFEGRQANLAQAAKLTKTFATGLEALNRHRGKVSQQTVVVKHVTVEAGAQAVVGFVEPTGGRKSLELEDQAYAKQISDAPVQTLRCQDTPRDILPVASDAERPVPYARRVKSRCS